MPSFANQTLKAKFEIIGALAAAAVLAAAINSYVTLQTVIRQAEQVEVAGQLLQNHMDGDMMHDAIRADVLKATMAVKTGNVGMAEESVGEAQEHAERFVGNLKKNMALDIPEEMKKLLEEESPALDSYAQMAGKYTAAAVADVKGGARHTEDLFPEFEKAFGVLEGQQAALSDKITAYATALKDEQVRTAARSRHLSLLLAAVAIALSVSVPFFSRSALFAPLNRLISANQNLAEGKVDTDVPFIGRRDEIGQMAATLQVFKRSAEEKIRLESEQEAQKIRAADDKKKAMNDLAKSFESQVGSIINGVSSAALQLRGAAETMRGTAGEASAQSATVAAASEEASANVQTVASATEELSSSVHRIQDIVSRSNIMVQQAANEAESTNRKVSGLTQAANKIGAVVQMITDIAAQTNLLALNATIEAARAGEAGKGFAVVASEVKNLAGQTAKATDEIVLQIQNIQQETQASAEAISNITKAIGEITQTSSAVIAAVEGQGAAVQEISRNIGEAAVGAQDVSFNIVKVSDAAQRTGTAASQVLSAADDLSKSSEDLKKQVDAFLQKIRMS